MAPTAPALSAPPACGAHAAPRVLRGPLRAGTDLSPILPVLAKVFDQALEGGGAKNINFQELAADLAQITFDYPFRQPPPPAKLCLPERAVLPACSPAARWAPQRAARLPMLKPGGSPRSPSVPPLAVKAPKVPRALPDQLSWGTASMLLRRPRLSSHKALHTWLAGWAGTSAWLHARISPPATLPAAACTAPCSAGCWGLPSAGARARASGSHHAEQGQRGQHG